MTITTLAGWVADGQKFLQCQPLLDLRATLGRYGYTGPATGYPDLRHLQAHPPEDHCPFSNTPWPGPQPYPYCMALDIMPSNAFNWVTLMGRLVADKNAGVPGTEPIKYINWTDVDGQCWHETWMPNHSRSKSTDTGHGHISIRTDFVHSRLMATYDPIGGEMAKLIRRNSDGAVFVTNGPWRQHITPAGVANAIALWGPWTAVDTFDGTGRDVDELATGGPAGTPTTLTLLTVPAPPA